MLRLHVDPQGPVRDAALECEFDVFGAQFGNTRQQLVEEYARYDAASVFVAVSDETGQVVATSRLILPSAAGQKTLDDIAGPPWHAPSQRSAEAAGLRPGSTWDVATLVARRISPPRKQMAVAAMWYGLMASGQLNDVTHIMAILDERVRERMAAIGLLMRELPGTGTRPYLGSARSTPVYAGFPQMLARQRQLNPDAYRLVTLGIGLDGVVVPDRETFRLRTGPAVVDVRERHHSSTRGTRHREV